MPPEDLPSQVTSEAIDPGDAWNGPWGAISPVANSIATLCIEIENETRKPRIYYYPYRTIGKWNWSMGAPETLEIQAGAVQVTISGTSLRRLADALNKGQLELVRLSQPPTSTGESCIRNIHIEDGKS